jgi:hypothetical protein
LRDALADYGVRTIYGKDSPEERSRNRRIFQQDDDICQVIVVNPTVGGQGISLDDQHGDRPRTTLIFPDPRFMDLVQFSYRTWRAMTKSQDRTEIHLVFSPNFRRQANILNKLVEKSRDARKVIKGSELRLPAEYDSQDVNILIDGSVELPPLPTMNTTTEI